jgi:hypothetical protein
MSPAEIELAYRAALRSLPNYRFGHEQLVHLLSILPPPPPGAPVTWRHAHLGQIIQEIRALDPRNPAEAGLGQTIISFRHLAAHLARRSFDPTASAQQVAELRRTAERLLRTATQTERLLKQRQAGRNTPGHPPLELEVDLAALDAVWCGIAGQPPVPGVDPMGLRSDPHAGVEAPSLAAPDPTERVKYTLCGQRIDLVRLATMPAAGSA